MELLRMDKKRNGDSIDYVLLSDIAKPLIQMLSFHLIEQTAEIFSHAGKY
jgi:hypothetical protein